LSRPVDRLIQNYFYCNELEARGGRAWIGDAAPRLTNALDADFLLLGEGNYGRVRAP
jgi:hypothetical protein